MHGVLVSVSRVKKDRNSTYFEGTITNGDSKMRLVGFHKGQQTKMSSLWRMKKVVRLNNCEIKRSRNSEKMDIILKSTTDTAESSKTIFDASNVDFGSGDGGDMIVLSQLGGSENLDRVDICCKVVTTRDAFQVYGGKSKQEVIVSDRTGVGLVTLWEDDVGGLTEGASYSLTGFLVRRFAYKKMFTYCILLQLVDKSSQYHLSKLAQSTTASSFFKT